MTATESRFVETLRSFDGHERGILMQWAMGTDFAPSSDLRRDLGKLLPVDIPGRAFVAMDYTLDWLYAAMQRYDGILVNEPQPRPVGRRLTASPEDIDLLIAWEDERPRLLLVEAKGYTGWSNKQLLSKVERIGTTFDEEARRDIDVHFVLVGPKHSVGFQTQAWPPWILKEHRYHFLPIPSPGERFAVQRCNADGKPTKADWTHWQVVPRSWPVDPGVVA